MLSQLRPIQTSNQAEAECIRIREASEVGVILREQVHQEANDSIGGQRGITERLGKRGENGTERVDGAKDNRQGFQVEEEAIPYK